MTEFQGTIGRTLAESTPHFMEPPHPGEDSPNVVIVLIDDLGFAQFGCYGSDIDTSNVDALCAGGVQFTNFHVTPLCSPTRAALLTGRSQHAVGMRGVSNWRTGFPHQLGHISNAASTIAEVLSSEGYATFCTGKWHLAPTADTSAAGPFDQWPLGRGFERFYGFLPGETDQFNPELVRDNSFIDPPATVEEGYHLSEDLVDQLLLMINDNKGLRPDRPFFAYLPFGATHAPHQAPEEYLAKYRGRYDAGWDIVRKQWFDRQVELGVIDPDTTLAPRNPGVEAWDDLSDAQQRFAARLQEAFAAFLDHTDDQIGRFVDGLRDMGELDNARVTVHGDGEQSRDFTYVGTVTGTITEAVLRKVTSDVPVNLAFGSRIALLDTLAKLEELIGSPIERNPIESRAGDVRHSQADNARLLALFPGLTPVPFDEGLAATVDWMRTTIEPS